MKCDILSGLLCWFLISHAWHGVCACYDGKNVWHEFFLSVQKNTHTCSWCPLYAVLLKTPAHHHQSLSFRIVLKIPNNNSSVHTNAEQYCRNILHFNFATLIALLMSGISSSGSPAHTEQFSLTAGFIIDVTVSNLWGRHWPVCHLDGNLNHNSLEWTGQLHTHTGSSYRNTEVAKEIGA